MVPRMVAVLLLDGISPLLPTELSSLVILGNPITNDKEVITEVAVKLLESYGGPLYRAKIHGWVFTAKKKCLKMVYLLHLALGT